MLENINEVIRLIPLAGVITMPLTTGLTQAIKTGFNLQTRWIPLTAAITGSIIGLILLGLNVVGGVVGLISGLAGVGLYEFGKTTIMNKQ